MFGYVVINKSDLRIRDFYEYKSYYCGLCRQLKKGYGIKGQFTLTYDLTFLSVLLTGLYEPESTYSECKCIAHPLTKHTVINNELISYAADMSVLLSYYKFLDDWHDDNKLSKKICSDILKKSGQEVASKYPDKAAAISEELTKLSEYEASGSGDLDAVAGCFGRMMSAVFVYKHDEWEGYLSKMGFYLGKYIYLLDAYVDLDEDTEKSRYNPLKFGNSDSEYVRELLTMMMAECTKSFEMLPVLTNFDILENILYSGVWTGFYTGRPLNKNEIMQID